MNHYTLCCSFDNVSDPAPTLGIYATDRDSAERIARHAMMMLPELATTWIVI